MNYWFWMHLEHLHRLGGEDKAIFCRTFVTDRCTVEWECIKSFVRKRTSKGAARITKQLIKGEILTVVFHFRPIFLNFFGRSASLDSHKWINQLCLKFSFGRLIWHFFFIKARSSYGSIHYELSSLSTRQS
jgi:hypothetical protein